MAPKRRNTALAVTCVLVLLGWKAPTAWAIFRRPDRNEADYRKLGSQFPAVCWIPEPGASGTLIAPNWILTAAHFMTEGRPRAGDLVQFGDRGYAIKNATIHPEYPDNPEADLALLELAERVTEVQPMELFVGHDVVGRHCTVVGFGWPGVIAQKLPAPTDDEQFVPVRRAGTNTLHRMTDQLLFTKIQVDESATDLEAAMGVGDSGGPLLVETGDRFAVAGVVSGFVVSKADVDMLGRKNSEDMFVRVSPFVPWIEDTTGQNFGAFRIDRWIFPLGVALVVASGWGFLRRRRRRRLLALAQPMNQASGADTAKSSG